MSTLSLRLPDSLHKELKELSIEDGISINQFISLAVAEKISCLRTVEHLKKRARKGKAAKFISILDSAPDVTPPDDDKINQR